MIPVDVNFCTGINDAGFSMPAAALVPSLGMAHQCIRREARMKSLARNFNTGYGLASCL